MSAFHFPYHTERLSTGNKLCFIDQHPANGAPRATLLCIHGFPDFSYGWRYQIQPWAKAGFRVIVPDTLGYGGSDKPQETTAYSIKNVANDLVALLDKLNVAEVVVIGHDWGAMVAWRFLQWYPSRVKALVALSIPYYPPPPQYIPLEEAAKRVPSFGYQVYFADERSTAEIDANVERFFRAIYRRPGLDGSISRLGEIQQLVLGNAPFEDKPLLSPEELKHYVTTFKQGMHGPLSYYRNTRLNFEEYSVLPVELPSDKPIHFIYGTEDPACAERAVKASLKFAPHMSQVRLDGRGHWIMVEAKDEVTQSIISFVNRVVDPTAKL
ncbi:epoxide hydrolase [Auricularia subglabra TFB-10046 SS5]|nr:epoxide hydrolase [Auricularia subglabra TFB-10046 SS5]